MREAALFVLAVVFLVFSCAKEKGQDKTYFVLGTEPVGMLSIMESQDRALVNWAESGIEDAVLVHVDAHDDMGEVFEEEIKRVRGLIKAKKWEALEPGISRGDKGIVNSSSYLYAAVRLGIVKEIYWVLPYRLFDDIPLAEKGIKRFLKYAGTKFLENEVNSMKMEFGCLTGRLREVHVRICSPRTLPKIEKPVVLSVDANFFPAMAFDYRMSKLKTLKMFFDEMNFRHLKVMRVDMSYSIRDGKTIPIHRYIGDELIEFLKDPKIITAEYPPELWKFRDMAENMLSGGEDKRVVEYLAEPLKKYPEDMPLRLLNATAKLLIERFDDAFKEVDALCRMDVHYCYGFEYMASLLIEKKRDKQAEKFLKHLIKLYEGRGQQEKADAVRRRFNVDMKGR